MYINTGGEKVYPGEVEDIISENTKVEHVAIVGVPDERWGEAVTAIVQLRKNKKATEEEIIDFCRGKMARYKLPKKVIFVDSMPLMAEGRPWYPKIKEMLKKER